MTRTPDSGWLEQARRIVGGHLLTDPVDLEKYSHDELATPQYNALPAAVLKPGSEEEVAELVRLCARTGVPLTPRGGGTGLAAACVPSPGGVVLSLERLDHVVEADADNLAITVQAGLTLNRLNQEAEALGLYFPPHPGDIITRVTSGPAAQGRLPCKAPSAGELGSRTLAFRAVAAAARPGSGLPAWYPAPWSCWSTGCWPAPSAT